MMTKQQLIDQLIKLRELRKQYFDDGLWDKADFIQLCIDDTNDDLKRLSTSFPERKQ